MIDLNWLTLLLGTGLPIVTGLVTARVAHPGLKATVLALLSALGGVGSELYSVGGDTAVFDWSASAANAVTVFLIGVGMHYGLLRPAGVTGSDGAVQTGALSGGLGHQPPAHAKEEETP